MKLLAVRAVPADVNSPIARRDELARHRRVGDAAFLVPERVLVGIEDHADRDASPACLEQRLHDGAIGKVEHRDVDAVALAGGIQALQDGIEYGALGYHPDPRRAACRDVRAVTHGCRRGSSRGAILAADFAGDRGLRAARFRGGDVNAALPT